MTQLFPRIRRVAAAITISPRMVAVLAAAWHFTERLNASLLVIHGGAPDVGENQLAFELNRNLLVSKLIEGTYPNYRQVIPAEAK